MSISSFLTSDRFARGPWRAARAFVVGFVVAYVLMEATTALLVPPLRVLPLWLPSIAFVALAHRLGAGVLAGAWLGGLASAAPDIAANLGTSIDGLTIADAGGWSGAGVLQGWISWRAFERWLARSGRVDTLVEAASCVWAVVPLGAVVGGLAGPIVAASLGRLEWQFVAPATVVVTLAFAFATLAGLPVALVFARGMELSPRALAKQAGAFAVVLVVFLVARRIESDAITREFENLARRAADDVETSARASFVRLRALVAERQSAAICDAASFTRFVDSWLTQDDPLQTVAWIPRVAGTDRAAYEARIRLELGRDVPIVDITPVGSVAPAAQRLEHFPVEVIAPAGAGAFDEVGSDLAGCTAFLRPIDTARSTRRITASPPMRIDDDDPRSLIVMVFAPVFASATPAPGEFASTAPDGLVGFVLGLLSVERVVAAAVDSEVREHLVFELRDLGNGHPASFDSRDLYPSAPAAGLSQRFGCSTEKVAMFGGRKWSMRIQSAPSFALREQQYGAWFVLVLGTFAASALGFSRIASIRRGTRIEELVAARTEQIQAANARLEEARAQAERAARAKTDFLAHVSHEIRTPITVIEGYAELLASLRLTVEERERHARAIHRSARHLLVLVDDVLDAAKLEAGQMTVHLERASAAAIVAEVVAQLRPSADAKGLALCARAAGPVPAWIETDPTRLRQILVNLVGNAIKFTDHGSISIDVGLRAGETSLLAFRVLDTGPGVPEADRERIFGAFEQGDGSTSSRHGGSGLGLAISRRLARLLGGDVVVEDAPHGGASFVCTVACGSLSGVRLIETLEAVDREPVAPTPEPLRRLQGQVLVAEDDPDTRNLLERILVDAGARVTCVEDGRAAIQALETAERPFSLVVLDMRMPHLDGYTTAALARRGGYDGPILALTAHAGQPARERCLAVGCDEHLEKPVSRHVLIETCATLVARAGQRKSAVRSGKPPL